MPCTALSAAHSDLGIGDSGSSLGGRESRGTDRVAPPKAARVREPELPRPFRVPGGMFGAVAVGIAPMLLLGFSVFRSQTEQVLGMSSFAFGMILIGAGVVAYGLNHALKPTGWTPSADKAAGPVVSEQGSLAG